MEAAAADHAIALSYRSWPFRSRGHGGHDCVLALCQVIRSCHGAVAVTNFGVRPQPTNQQTGGWCWIAVGHPAEHPAEDMDTYTTGTASAAIRSCRYLHPI